ncbi:MAG: DUF790 family protein [Promethearchaeota archaeon]
MSFSMIEFKRGKAGWHVPVIMDENNPEFLHEVINYLDSNIGKPFHSVKEKFPINAKFGIKKSRFLKEVIFNALYSSKSKVENFSCSMDYSALRIKLFEFLNERYHGFSFPPESLSSTERFTIEKMPTYDKIIQEFREHLSLNLSSRELIDFLFQDHVANLVLAKIHPGKITPIDLVRACNKEIIHLIIRNSSRLYFVFSGKLKGSQFRKMHYFITRSGLYCDFFLSENDGSSLDIRMAEINNFLFRIQEMLARKVQDNGNMIILEILLPEEMISRKHKLGLNLLKIVNHVHQRYFKKLFMFPISVVKYRNRDLLVDISQLKEYMLPGNDRSKKKDVEDSDVTSFDSVVEKEFFNRIKGNSKLMSKIKRDADVLFVRLENSVSLNAFIPDFQFTYHGKDLFIEIVGYWTESYKNRKVQKLSSLSKDWKEKLILIIDKSINFPKVDFPSFFYEKNQFPMQDIINFISSWENKIFQLVESELLDKLVENIKKAKAAGSTISINEITRGANLASENETIRLLDTHWKLLKKEFELVRLSANHLISRQVFEKWKKWIRSLFINKKKNILPKHVITQKLQDKIPESLIEPFVRKIGLKITYKGLFNVDIEANEEFLETKE